MTGRGSVREYQRRVNSLWLVPLLCILLAALAAVVTLTVDGLAGYDLLPQRVLGTPTAVQTILSTAASSMLTLTTIVLTVMTLGVQLAHGLFAGTFLFCMVAVAAVDDKGSAGHQVPSVTVAFAYLLLLASLVTLVAYVHHAGQSLRVAGLVDLVGDRLQAEIERSFPPEGRVPAEDGVVAADAGVVVMLDVGGLVELARRSDDCIEMLVMVGDFVPRGAPLLRSRGGRRLDAAAVRRTVLFDNARSHIGDAAYGFRKLVDITERSIASSPWDDPATAVQAVDRIHDAVRQLCFRRLPDAEHHDAAGTLRLVTRELSWQGYVAVAFDEVVSAGASSPLVARRLLAAFDDLVAVAPAARRPPLEAQRRRLIANAGDEGIPLVPDVQGLGSGPDLREEP